MTSRIVIICSYKRFQTLSKEIERKTAKLFKLVNQRNSCLEIYLVGKAFMDKNVLAFPASKNFPRPDKKGKFLGEIYLNPDYIKKHNEDIFFMLCHGFLHLLGYEHKKKDDRIKMEKKERELLRKLTTGN